MIVEQYRGFLLQDLIVFYSAFSNLNITWKGKVLFFPSFSFFDKKMEAKREKMSKIFVAAVVIVMLSAAIPIVAADGPTWSGVYEGAVTVNGDPAPLPDLTVLAQVRGDFVGSSSIRTYTRCDVHGGLYVNGRFQDTDEITFFLRDFCGNEIHASSTDPSPVYCDPYREVHTVNLTFLNVPCPVPPTTPTPVPAAVAPLVIQWFWILIALIAAALIVSVAYVLRRRP